MYNIKSDILYFKDKVILQLKSQYLGKYFDEFISIKFRSFN